MPGDCHLPNTRVHGHFFPTLGANLWQRLTHISFHYEAEKADCLNDDKHDFQLTHTIPVEASKMRCTMCDKERHLTDQERKEFGIGTLEDYFKSL